MNEAREFERACNAVGRYADEAGVSPIEAAARVLRYCILRYRSRETAMEFANRGLNNDLQLIEQNRETEHAD
jgi:hypothetical protein